MISACDVRHCSSDAFFQIKVRHSPSCLATVLAYLDLLNTNAGGGLGAHG